MLSILLLSLRALGRGRRLLVVAVLLAVPALLTLAYVASDAQGDGIHFATTVFNNLILPVLLPLTAMIFATSALGSEIEDRTLIYLTLRPVPRPMIVLAKLLAAALISVLLVELSVVTMYLIAHQRPSPIHYVVNGQLIKQGEILSALVLAGLGGALAYSSIFLLLGLLAPRRALIIGFVYVLGWEGIAAGLSTALATLSIRRYVQGALDARLSPSPLAGLDASTIDGGTCGAVLAALVVAGLVLSTIQLRRLELP